MPYINVKVAKKVDDEIRNKFQLEMGKNISIIPDKTMEFTTVVIEDDCVMYKNGEHVEGVFIEVRLFKESPENAKKAYTEKLFTITEDILNVTPDHTHVNYFEFSAWGAGGNYMT